MKKKPLLTVGIPTFNRKDWLKKAIESVLKQSYTDFILLISDNASSDGTEEMVKSFSDDRIRYFKNQTNIGAIANMNKIFELADTKYVSIFHDDDIMEPILLEEEVKILEENNDVAMVFSNIKLMDEEENLIQTYSLEVAQDIVLKQYDFIKRMYQTGFFLPFPTAMMRLDYVLQNNLIFSQEVGLCCDAFNWIKANTLEKKIYFLHKSLLNYRTKKYNNEQGYPFNGIYYINQFLLHENVFLLLNKNTKEQEILRSLAKLKLWELVLKVISDHYKGIGNKDEILSYLAQRDVLFTILGKKLNNFISSFKKNPFFRIKLKFLSYLIKKRIFSTL